MSSSVHVMTLREPGCQCFCPEGRIKMRALAVSRHRVPCVYVHMVTIRLDLSNALDRHVARRLQGLASTQSGKCWVQSKLNRKVGRGIRARPFRGMMSVINALPNRLHETENTPPPLNISMVPVPREAG